MKTPRVTTTIRMTDELMRRLLAFVFAQKQLDRSYSMNDALVQALEQFLKEKEK